MNGSTSHPWAWGRLQESESRGEVQNTAHSPEEAQDATELLGELEK